MALENDSEFLPSQVDICEVGPKKEKEKDKVCPTCIPDENFVPPEWWTMDKPFLNKKTCEYSIGVIINENGDTFKVDTIAAEVESNGFEALKRSYVKPGIRMMLQYYGKMISDEIICALPPQQPGEKCGPTFDVNFRDYIKFIEEPVDMGTAKLVAHSVPVLEELDDPPVVGGRAINLNALEVYARTPEFRFTTESSNGILQVLITVPAFVFDKVPEAPSLPEVDTDIEKVTMDAEEFYLAMNETIAALEVFSKYQSYFYQTENGNLFFEDTQKPFYLKNVAVRMKSFLSSFESLIENNGLRFGGGISFLPKAHKIEIVFDKSSEEKPFRIKRIRAKQKGCRWKKMKKGFQDPFLKKGPVRDQTTMGYIAAIKKIHPRLTARETPPWLDFTIQYTFPQLAIDFGSANKFSDQRPDTCLSDTNAISNVILNGVLSFSDAFAYQLNKANCLSMYGPDYIFETTPLDFNERDLSLLGTVPTFGFDPDRFKAETFSGKAGYMKEYVQNKLRKQGRTIKETSPILKALEQFKTSFEGDENVGDGLRTLMNVFTPCTFKDFGLTLLKCLFRGVDANTAYMSVIKATLGNLASEGLEVVIQALPADKQEEIRQKVEEEFGNMPAPWEPGWKAGSLKQPRINRATEAKDKRLNAESGTLKLKNRIKEQLSKLKSTGFAGNLNISFATDAVGLVPPMEGYVIVYDPSTEKGYSSIDFTSEEKPLGDTDSKIDVFKFKIEQTPEQINEYITNIAKYVPIENNPKIQETIDSMIDSKATENVKLIEELEDLKAEEARFTSIIVSDTSTNQEKNNATNSRFQTRIDIEKIDDQIIQNAKDIDRLKSGTSAEVKIVHKKITKIALTSLNKIEQMRGESLTIQKDLQETRQYDNWNNLTEKEQQDLIEEEANKNRFATLNPGDNYEQGTLGKALGNTQQAITKAYVEAIIETAEIQQIMRALDNLPGIKILGSFIATFKCPKTHFIYPPIDSFLSTLTFDICDLEKTDLALPMIPQFPRFSWSFIFDNLVKAFISALKITIKQAFAALFAKLAQLIDASLCKLLGFELPNIPSLMDILGRADCKESEILKAAGAAPPGRAPLPDEEYAALANTISNAGSEIQMKRALTGNADRDYLRNVANAIAIDSPAFSDVLSSPEALGEFFQAASGLLTPEQLSAIEEEVDTSPIIDSPTNKCLTNDELKVAKNNTNEALSGLPDEVLAEYNDQEQDRAQDNIDQVLGIVLNGPNSVLNDIIDQALQPNVDPDCVDNINSVGAVLKKARDTPSFKIAKEGIFARTQKAFMDDMIDWNLFEIGIGKDTPGILGQILADKKGRTLNYYNWYRNLKSSLGFFDFLPDAADLPKTVGISLREQFLKEEKQWDQNATPKMNFRFEGEDENGTFETNIKVFDGGMDSFAHKIRIVTPEFTDFEIEAHEEVKEIHEKMITDLQPYVENEGRYRARMMRAFIRKAWSGFQNTTITEQNAENLIGSLNKAMFEKMMNKLVSDSRGQTSQGFLYGYDPVEITADDLTYVNPEPGSVEYTYDESSRVLGRSLTNNPRVQFLDPAQHGGTYSAPFYNILAEEKQGWSQFAKSIVSSTKGCDDVQTNFLFLQDILDQMSEEESRIKPDDRLRLAPDCVIEKPFDKIASPTTLSNLGGIVTAIIRMHVVDYMLRTFSINANVNMSFDKNHSKMISKLIVNRMTESLSNQFSVFTSTYEGSTYWLLFLEQAVQLLKRKIDNADMESDPRLDEIMNTINEAQKSHIVPTYADVFGDYSNESIVDNVSVGAVILAGGLLAAPLVTTVGVTLSTAFALNQLKLAAKVGTIYSVYNECRESLEYLVEEQLDFYSDILFEVVEPRPYVHDISKFFIGASKSMIKGDIRAGEVEVESPTGGVSNFDYGTIPDCVHDINTEHPFDGMELNKSELFFDGGFFLEKYLRVEDKEVTPQTISLERIQLDRQFVTNRDENLKGVVNIQKFKEFLAANEGKIPADANVSDFFGNAKPNLTEEGYNGSIGIKFGVRLCCVMPFEFKPFSTPSGEAVNFPLAQREKSFIFKTPPTEESRYIFPLCSYERDIPDNKLASYINSDNNFNQDLKCYVDQMCETAEFKLLFDHIVSTKRIPSIAAVYSYLNFYPSLGKGENEREDTDDIVPVRLESLFNDTKHELRKLFVANYKRKDFDPEDEEDSEGGFIKNLARDVLSKTVNNIFLGSGVPWWMKTRYKRKKVDEDGEPCGNQFGGLVSINDEGGE